MTGSAARDIRTQIEDVVRRIVTCAQPEKIILFGSHARGDAGPDSDLDLLVVARASGSSRLQALAMERSLIGVDLPVDLVVVTPQDLERDRDRPGTLIRPALQEGETLYERRS